MAERERATYLLLDGQSFASQLPGPELFDSGGGRLRFPRHLVRSQGSHPRRLQPRHLHFQTLEFGQFVRGEHRTLCPPPP